jgi:signal transduction histidine kinase
MSEKRVGLRWGASGSRIFRGSIIALMEPVRGGRRRRRTIRLDVALLATAGILLVATLLPQLDPDLSIFVKDRTLDVALSALTTLAVATLAALSLMRFRETGRLASYVQSSAYALWASFSGATLLLIVFRLDGRVGLSLAAPEQLPAWVAEAVRLGVAALFLVSGIAAFMGIYGGTRRRVRKIFLPVAVIAVGAVLLYPLRDLLPPLIEPAGLQALLAEPAESGLVPGVSALAVATVIASVTCLLAAVMLYRLTWGRGGPSSDAFTALGLVILIVGEVQDAFWPSVYSNVVTVADLMRLIAYIVLGAGAIADQRMDLRALRSAYAALDRLRVNDAERAALEERARLAREIHDGLAQHLWFAKLKFERLAGTLAEPDQALAGEVSQALDAAIVEAREALVTMRASLTEDVPFADMLTRSIDDFESQSGLRVEFVASTGLPANLAPRMQVELLRIVSEALTNVRKHADATMVRIRAEVSEGELVITVTDNGRGFVQEEAIDRGMGLRGMLERARLVGGSLHVMSEPSGGTTIEIRAPLVTRGVPATPEPSERMPMAPEDDLSLDDLQLALPEVFPEHGASGIAGLRTAPDVPAVAGMPGVAAVPAGPDARATGMQP